MILLRRILAAALTVVSGYTLLHSYSSIPKLQKYEKNAEKAAEWSNAAEKRLWDTRYTVGAGLVAASVSLLTAFLSVFSVGAGIWAVMWPLGLAVAEIYASRYMRIFWADKAKIPMMDEYNAAIEDTGNVMDLLNILGLGWGIMGLLKVFGY